MKPRNYLPPLARLRERIARILWVKGRTEVRALAGVLQLPEPEVKRVCDWWWFDSHGKNGYGYGTVELSASGRQAVRGLVKEG